MSSCDIGQSQLCTICVIVQLASTSAMFVEGLHKNYFAKTLFRQLTAIMVCKIVDFTEIILVHDLMIKKDTVYVVIFG